MLKYTLDVLLGCSAAAIICTSVCCCFFKLHTCVIRFLFHINTSILHIILKYCIIFTIMKYKNKYRTIHIKQMNWVWSVACFEHRSLERFFLHHRQKCNPLGKFVFNNSPNPSISFQNYSSFDSLQKCIRRHSFLCTSM